MRPAAPQQHAAGTAGLVNSAAREGDAVQPLRRGPVFPWIRALLVVAIIAASVASPLLGSFSVLFGVALIALGMTRGAGTAFVIASAVGSAIASMLLVMANASDTPDLGVVLGLAALCSVLAVVLGVEHARAADPDPGASAKTEAKRERVRDGQTLAEQMQADRLEAAAVAAPAESTEASWPEPRADRGVSYVSYAWLVASIIIVVAVGFGIGESRLRNSLSSTVDTGFAGYDESCAEGGVLENDDRTCDQIETTREFFEEAARDHAPTMFALFMSFAAITGAWLAHVIVVTRNRALMQQRWVVPTRPAYRLRQLEFHWSWAYVAILGVAALIATHALSGDAHEWTLAAGTGITSVAGQVIMMHGTGMAAWLLTRRRIPGWYRVVLIVTTLFIWPFVIGGLLVLGALDMQFGFRRKAASAPTAT